MAVKIQWQPPLVPEVRKRAQWEKIIRHELGEIEDPLDVSLSFEEDSLRWRVDAQSRQGSGTRAMPEYRGRVVDALRAHGKPVA